MKVAVITTEEKNILIYEIYGAGLKFNPILDKNNNFVISQDEKIEAEKILKNELILIDYAPIIYNL